MLDKPTSNDLSNVPALYFFDGGGAKYFSQAEYHEASLSITRLLGNKGFQHGDRIAFRAQNTVEMASLLLACLRMGYVAMPLSPRFPQQTINELVRIAGAKFLDDTELLALISSAHKEISNMEHRFIFGESEKFFRNIALDNPATILCTSGSTGLPKMILHTVANHYWNAVGAAENIPFDGGDCWLQSLPLYHVGGYGIFFRAAVAGTAIAFPNTTVFNVRQLTETLTELPITHCSFVATQLYHALRHEPLMARLRSMKAIILGGSAISQTLVAQALEAGLKIFTSYGSTEMASQISTSISSEASELRTSGTVLPHREVCISHDGEILVRGKTLAKGRVTEQGIVPLVGDDGWYHTRDLGALDLMRRLTVLGRLDNMFISGGENIHPEAIEQVLCDRRDVVQAIVVPVPDEVYGFRPVAFLQREQNKSLHQSWLQEIRKQLESALPRFAIPDHFFTFPQESIVSGIKPNRATLQELAQNLIKE
jgi:O-succinylbenzoic acid--CoA ligase